MSIYLNNIKGGASIANNSIRGSVAGLNTSSNGARAAIRVDNIIDAANVDIVGNHFEGVAGSGGALYFDRTSTTVASAAHTASKCHLTLRDNLCRSMGQTTEWDGLIDADLGGGLIKQRVARPGQGRSGGFRMIVAYRTEDRAFFLYGFAKSERENIDDDELQTLRDIAAEFLANDDTALDEAVSIGKLQEIENGEDA